MLIHVEELDNWKRKLRIGLSEAAVNDRIEELYGELAKRAEAPVPSPTASAKPPSSHEWCAGRLAGNGRCIRYAIRSSVVLVP